MVGLPAHPLCRSVLGVGLRLLAWWNCGFESRQEQRCLSLVNVVFCRIDVSASGGSLVQRSSTDSGVCDCDCEAFIIWRPRPTRGCCYMGRNIRLWSSISLHYSLLRHTRYVPVLTGRCTVNTHTNTHTLFWHSNEHMLHTLNWKVFLSSLISLYFLLTSSTKFL
jgi:hypothetical protein